MRASYETSLAVADYLRGRDTSLAFDAAASDGEAALRAAQRELRGMGLRRARAVGARFLEFDSGNASHAGAYYEVTVEGVTAEELSRAMEF